MVCERDHGEVLEDKTGAYDNKCVSPGVKVINTDHGDSCGPRSEITTKETEQAHPGV